MRRGFVLYARIEAFCSAVIVKQPSSDNTPYEKIGDEVHPLDTPFDIPESWEWVRHNDLFEISGGAQPPKSKFIILTKPISRISVRTISLLILNPSFFITAAILAAPKI